MKITVSQHGKKLIIEFRAGKLIDKYTIDKAEDFLVALDSFVKKRKIDLAVLKKAELEFVDVRMLTERIIKAIMKGLTINL